MGIFDLLKKKLKGSPNKCVILGLDNSGKTTIISFFQKGRFVEHTPTMGKSIKKIDIKGILISIVDVGGQVDFRDIWVGELENAKCLVYVIDKTDKNRFTEAKIELNKLMQLVVKKDIKLLILANKHDLPNAVSLGEIIKQFDLTTISSEFEILNISGKTGYGLMDALAKIISFLINEPVQKHIFGKIVSLYNKDREVLLTRGVNDNGIQSQLKNFEMEINTIPEEFKVYYKDFRDNQKIIFLKSSQFIGSILWSSDLGVSIDQSENVLFELLEHLENLTKSNDNNDIIFYTEHYLTNII